MTIDLVDILRWPGTWFTAGVLLALGVAVLRIWKKHYSGTIGELKGPVLRLSVANLLQVISLGITVVSILLPADAALAVYLVGVLPRTEAHRIVPLLLAIFVLGLAFLVGITNAFTYAIQSRNGETAEWDYRHWKYPPLFALQWGLTCAAVVLMCVPLLSGIPLPSAPNEPTPNPATHQGVEKQMDYLDKFDHEIERALLPGENKADLTTAARIIVEERMVYADLTAPGDDDISIALCSLCLPIPVCPPKSPSYTAEVHALRQRVLKGLAQNDRLQRRLRSSITVELRAKDLASLKFESLTTFILLTADSA